MVMNMFKAHWTTQGENVRLSMPFSKVDAERRIVSGFATLDNIDKQADIVTTEASMKAFSKFRGNIREMHQPSAVGKMVSFKEDKYFDPETKKFYSGVFVSAYISKGAQDAWEKVTDGTYTGFSIGGRMNKWDDGYDEKSDSPIRIIKEYDLVELSLVDNPANQFANIVSIEKNTEGENILTGSATNIVVENVFWDSDSGLVMVSENEFELSPRTGNPMQNIGFVEKNDDEKNDLIKFLVDSAKGINTSKINKEASPMNETTEIVEETVEKSDAAVEETTEVAPEADAVVAKSDEEKEKSEYASEGMKEEEEDDEDEEMKSKKSDSPEAAEVSKNDEVIAEAVTEIKNTLTSAFSDLSATVKALHEQVAELSKSLGSVQNEVSSVKNEIESTKGAFDEFGKRVDAVEQDTAFRKSGDLGEVVQYQPEQVEKSLWGGRFLKTADLFK
jgi:hypothetical protein